MVEAPIVVGAYRLVQRIGAGGMGEVWAAEHALLGRRAAVKLLLPELSNRPEILTRFFNEARAATAISDPGIVQVFDYGQDAHGRAFIVMELLEGEPLDKRLQRLSVLSVPDALRIMRQVASSLGAAHARGIVHRDLKPENIFLMRDPEMPAGERAKILDFGIAKLTDDPIGPKSNTSSLVGTPTYMSPEQCRGTGQLDQRSDVYSLGCVLFTLVTGHPPFDGDGPGEVIAMHLREPTPLASSRRPEIAATVDDLIARCLAKDPHQRYASGAALASAIEALLTMPGFAAGPAPRGASAGGYTTRPPMTTLSSLAGQAPAPRKRRGTVIAAGIGLAAAIGASAAIWIVTRDAPGEHGAVAVASPPPPPAPAPAPGPATAPAPAAPAPAPAGTPKPPDEAERTARAIGAILTGFAPWASAHAGAPCPTAADLGAALGAHALDDGWGRPMAITCTDQPADQIIGVVSAGPDGAPGTQDDLPSWSLGRDVTAAVRGPRWKAAVALAPAKGSGKPRAKPTSKQAGRPAPTAGTPKPAAARPPSTDIDGDGIPDSR